MSENVFRYISSVYLSLGGRITRIVAVPQTGHKDLKTLMIYDRPEDALKSEENLRLVNAI